MRSPGNNHQPEPYNIGYHRAEDVDRRCVVHQPRSGIWAALRQRLRSAYNPNLYLERANSQDGQSEQQGLNRLVNIVLAFTHKPQTEECDQRSHQGDQVSEIYDEVCACSEHARGYTQLFGALSWRFLT